MVPRFAIFLFGAATVTVLRKPIRNTAKKVIGATMFATDGFNELIAEARKDLDEKSMAQPAKNKQVAVKS